MSTSPSHQGTALCVEETGTHVLDDVHVVVPPTHRARRLLILGEGSLPLAPQEQGIDQHKQPHAFGILDLVSREDKTGARDGGVPGPPRAAGRRSRCAQTHRGACNSRQSSSDAIAPALRVIVLSWGTVCTWPSGQFGTPAYQDQTPLCSQAKMRSLV